ncbi:hypothetical protein CORC01_14374 [Colletotrichum orchidophilum]|uniref:WAC domain-containing protein n=1 Tax=Colletotrichum orchidophilum TaxID=1209926 RepID=A0A1G4AMM1_9PEZI|nr:uncharacterized protein CORC01_14374 [Colletotrichum orchidophilum]OHE90325.1 hypothetical protein CORC01_14374 [Colletotrichum orchidophilum]
MQNLPELGHLHQAIESLRAETKTANENTTRETRTIRIAVQQDMVELEENTNATRAANAAAKEAQKASELAVKVVKDMKALEPMNQGNTAQSSRLTELLPAFGLRRAGPCHFLLAHYQQCTFVSAPDEFHPYTNIHNDIVAFLRISARQQSTTLPFAFVRESISRLETKTDRLEEKTNRLEAEMRQLHAYTRNNALKNPTLPIRPVVVYNPEQGIIEPKLTHFPRNANEFYSLRDPPPDRHRSMLAYLAVFYDVQLRTTDDSEGESSEDEVLLDRPDLIVEKLEGILGLNEDKFIKFRQRAREIGARPPSKPIKRSQVVLPATYFPPDPRRPRLDLRSGGARAEQQANRDADSASSEGLTNARIGWGSRSTPSSQRLRILYSPEELAHTARPRKRSPKPSKDERSRSISDMSESEPTDSSSQTRAFTNPRSQ